MFKGSKNAFTLAEVLITLGIIGVVAAMTMPTLLNSTQAARSKTGMKKVMNVLNQALVVNYALEDFDAGQATTGTEDQEMSLYGIFKKRTNIMKTDASGSNYVLYFNDGMTFEFPKNSNACTSTSPCKGVIDTIGGPSKGPGQVTHVPQSATRVKSEEIFDGWAVKIEGDKVTPNDKATELVMYNK